MRSILYTCGAILAAIIVILLDMLSSIGNYEVRTGIVLGKHYVPESLSTSVGTGIVTTPNGTMPVTTVSTDYREEEYILVVRRFNGEAENVDCTPDIYYTKSANDTLSYKAYYGRILGLHFKSGAK